MKNLLTIPDIERLYNLSRFRIMKAVEEGKLKAGRIGYTWTFKHQDIIDYVAWTKYAQQPVTQKDLRNLAFEMRKNNISQADLARKLNVSPSYISHVLAGRSPVSQSKFQELASKAAGHN